MKTLLSIRIPVKPLGRLLILLLLSFISWRLSLSADVKSALKDISRRGEPVDLMQLNSSSLHVPDDKNAARIWLAGFDQLVTTNKVHWQTPWSNIQLPTRGVTPSPELFREAVHLVETNRMALDTFRRAAATLNCQYPVEPRKTPWHDAQHVSKLRSIGKLLRLEAYVRAMEGDVDSATTATLTLLALGESVRNERARDSICVRAWINGLARTSLERMLNHAAFEEFHLGNLAAAFAQIEDEQMLARELVARRTELATILQRPYWYLTSYYERTPTRLERAQTAAAVLFIRATGWFDRDLLFGLNAFESLIGHAGKADPARFESHNQCAMLKQGALDGYYFESALTLMVASASVDRDAERRVAGRLARTAIAIERYRLAHSVLPDQLASLSPIFLSATLIDPFDGQPLRYKTCGQGYVVYSVGRDVADDGGAERLPNARADAPADITFVVER